MGTPALEYLLGTYFHQDFFEVYGGVWETVDAFVTRDFATAVEIPSEIRQTLARLTTEAELRDYLDEVECEYVAQPGDGGYLGWLAEVGRRVETAVADHPAH